MQVFNMKQGSIEWHYKRMGVPTASKAKSIMTAKGMKLSSSAGVYAVDLIADMVRGVPEEGSSYTSKAMQDGIDTEPEARNWFSLMYGPVEEVGFIMDDLNRFGCSPDGLTQDGGGLELKCLLTKTHAQLLDKHWGDTEVPPDYVAQCHFSMIVTGLPHWTFCSYSLGLPPLVIKVAQNDFTAKMRTCMSQFWTLFEKKQQLPQFKDAVLKFEEERKASLEEVVIF